MWVRKILLCNNNRRNKINYTLLIAYFTLFFFHSAVAALLSLLRQLKFSTFAGVCCHCCRWDLPLRWVHLRQWTLYTETLGLRPGRRLWWWQRWARLPAENMQSKYRVLLSRWRLCRQTLGVRWWTGLRGWLRWAGKCCNYTFLPFFFDFDRMILWRERN